MIDSKSDRGDFLSKATAVIVEQSSNDQFGVSELAEVLSMSRSNLLRKIKKATGLSASQFIRQVRLEIAMDMLKETSISVSEISYKVGFGSSSYFIKCFREHYGYSPGEVGSQEVENTEPKKQEPEALEISDEEPTRKIPTRALIITLSILGILIVSFLVFYKQAPPKVSDALPEKSIAVLPFKNESSDSSNLYFVNGLMESTLNNLQKIRDLRVISRSSVEKYRNTTKSIPEIAEELNVSYLVEGSGQKVGDQVLLNIQLIDASGDRHLWSAQYNREVVDIFAIQNEVATKIVNSVKPIVTPAELRQIQKKPTENLLAYDYYLQALDHFYYRTKEGLEKSIPLFEKAIKEDPQFALAYANVAIAYYFLDIYQAEKQYTDKINNYADKALLYDSRLPESLLAKAFYYMHTNEYRLALPHLEKALEYNPNSSAVIQTLADLYSQYIPNTSKYLEYALKGIQLDIAANDSIQKSYIYLHLSNALAQTGFVDEALKYINKSIEHHPENEYSPYLKAYILYAKDRDIERTKELLVREWQKDTTRLDILQEVAKLYYFQQDYETAFFYYDKFVKGKQRYGLDIYPHENAKIGIVYQKMGLEKEAEDLFKTYSDYCEGDQSIYKSASMAVKYVHEGKNDLAMEQLKVFATQDNVQYWIVLFMEMDPILAPLKSHPDFDKTMQKIEERFWKGHNQLRASLEEEGVI
ncbi:helix-turn-helix domain-containing protein [Salinimicrobium marinum]|nr:helix-turn-helix domain-containing protein [Salinimicrobium marinum]